VLEWLVVGGGIHGTYLLHLLLRRGGATPDAIRLLDPQPYLMALWRQHAHNCGMTFLRSPATHHIGIGILSLYRFARRQGRDRDEFTAPYNRPSLALFNDHSRWVIANNNLDGLHRCARVAAVRQTTGGVVVESEGGDHRARRVLLAVGLGEQPFWPVGARHLQASGAPVTHVFDPAFDRRRLPPDSRIAILGGSITALQLALQLVRDGARDVTVLAAADLRRSPYDFDPCWIGPKCLRRFYPAPPAARRGMIDAARVTGTVTPEVADAFEAAVAAGRLQFRRGRISAWKGDAHGVGLTQNGAKLDFDRLIVCTGFAATPPVPPLLAQIQREFGLARAACGYPLPDDGLRWHPRIYVAGPLAELALGPTARNIIGARNAGRLLLHGLGRGPRPPFL